MPLELGLPKLHSEAPQLLAVGDLPCYAFLAFHTIYKVDRSTQLLHLGLAVTGNTPPFNKE